MHTSASFNAERFSDIKPIEAKPALKCCLNLRLCLRVWLGGVFRELSSCHARSCFCRPAIIHAPDSPSYTLQPGARLEAFAPMYLALWGHQSQTYVHLFNRFCRSDSEWVWALLRWETLDSTLVPNMRVDFGFRQRQCPTSHRQGSGQNIPNSCIFPQLLS